MAIVVLYGRVGDTLTEAASAPVTFLSDRYVKPSFDLLPSGPAWPRDTDTTLYAFVRALSHSFARTDRRRDDLLRETDPREASELLDEWESCLDLDPGDLSDDDRRSQIVTLLRGNLSPTETNIVALALTLGYAIVITTYSKSLFTCVSPCTDPLYTATWLFVWTVTTPSAALDDELDALLAVITPLHTVRYMDFT